MMTAHRLVCQKTGYNWLLVARFRDIVATSFGLIALSIGQKARSYWTLKHYLLTSYESLTVTITYEHLFQSNLVTLSINTRHDKMSYPIGHNSTI